jgi:hypothetical protein
MRSARNSRRSSTFRFELLLTHGTAIEQDARGVLARALSA